MRFWEQVEERARQHLGETLGIEASLTGGSADGGIDVIAGDVVGQVKAIAKTVGRPDVQKLVGAAGGKQCVFYSIDGYSNQAEEYAAEFGVTLFVISLGGDVEPIGDIHLDMDIEWFEEEDPLDSYSLEFYRYLTPEDSCRHKGRVPCVSKGTIGCNLMLHGSPVGVMSLCRSHANKMTVESFPESGFRYDWQSHDGAAERFRQALAHKER